MLIHLSTYAVLEIVNDKPVAIGWQHTPYKHHWIDTRHEVEKLLGYSIVEWSAFTDPTTGMYWVEIGDARNHIPGEPRLVDILSPNPVLLID